MRIGASDRARSSAPRLRAAVRAVETAYRSRAVRSVSSPFVFQILPAFLLLTVVPVLLTTVRSIR